MRIPGSSRRRARNARLRSGLGRYGSGSSLWNVYCDDDDGCWRENGFAGLIIDLRAGDEDTGLFNESISPLVLPRSVILPRGECRGREDRSVGGNGGFCRPGLGEISSFWFCDGMDSFSESSSERS